MWHFWSQQCGPVSEQCLSQWNGVHHQKVFQNNSSLKLHFWYVPSVCMSIVILHKFTFLFLMPSHIPELVWIPQSFACFYALGFPCDIASQKSKSYWTFSWGREMRTLTPNFFSPDRWKGKARNSLLVFDPCSSVQSLNRVLTLCDPMNHSTSGLPIHHQLPEST